MMMTDQRIPVVFSGLDAAAATDAVLFEAPAQRFSGATASFGLGEMHPRNCVCCVGRGAAGRALGQLLHQRARGNVPFFQRVVVVYRSPEGRAAVEQALAADPLASACFRLA